MTTDSSAARRPDVLVPATTAGLWWGLLGVVAFSFTLPMTRVAVDHLSPLFIGAGRAVVAAGLATACLVATRQRLPRGRQWVRVAVVGGGVVVGFPLLTTYALATAPAAHAAVVIGVLPAATAVMTVIRGHERPPLAFWLAAGAGAVAAVVFASLQGSGLGELHRSDVFLFAAVVAASIGYAEGGLLARELGAWQTVSWAVVLCSPLMLALTVVSAVRDTPDGTPADWAAFAYLGAVSMFLGFVAWYRGLAIGPMAQVSQVQLVQPVLTISWAGLMLGEYLGWATIVGGVVVIACAASAVRVRLTSR